MQICELISSLCSYKIHIYFTRLESWAHKPFVKLAQASISAMLWRFYTESVNKAIHLSHFPSWWRHQMEAFSALLACCAGNSPVTGEFPAQRPVTRSFDVFFDLRLNKRLSKQSWGWWFETLSWSFWRHCNDSPSCITENGITTNLIKTYMP